MTASVTRSSNPPLLHDKHVGLRRERMHASPQSKDGRFRNMDNVRAPNLDNFEPSMAVDVLFRGANRSPKSALPIHDPRPLWQHAPETGLRVTWLGHSTLLLEIDGVRILTDPVFGERASPLSFMGPKRFHPVPVPISGLPQVDVLLLSHDHYDHLCQTSITQLARTPLQVVTALGVGDHLETYGMPPERIQELDWHESIELPGVRFTATPAQHFSGRGLRDRNTTLWASWVIETQHHKLFFSGDTGLFEGLSDIGRHYGPFDLTMLEIGAFHPAWGTIHLGPHNALQAHEMLQGRVLLPVHWGTFDLALHPWQEPAETLYSEASARGAQLLLPQLGQGLEPQRTPPMDPWWREVLRK